MRRYLHALGDRVTEFQPHSRRHQILRPLLWSGLLEYRSEKNSDSRFATRNYYRKTPCSIVCSRSMSKWILPRVSGIDENMLQAISRTLPRPGYLGLMNAMGAGDDAALRGLPEHFSEAHHRHGAG